MKSEDVCLSYLRPPKNLSYQHGDYCVIQTLDYTLSCSVADLKFWH